MKTLILMVVWLLLISSFVFAAPPGAVFGTCYIQDEPSSQNCCGVSIGSTCCYFDDGSINYFWKIPGNHECDVVVHCETYECQRHFLPECAINSDCDFLVAPDQCTDCVNQICVVDDQCVIHNMAQDAPEFPLYFGLIALVIAITLAIFISKRKH